ncbi:CpaD family pilus assembly lipoprotein [Lacibacterium aquatile]|uniref:CpaD family pilus assembly lipoprotein n=1 Tax=Lacibacterium aquatile TaxID=1168082 RepID=A0ABW5DRT4_9PROT
MFSIDRLTAITLACLLAACTLPPAPPSDPRLAHPITVKPVSVALALKGVQPDGSLSPRDISQAGALFDRYARVRRGPLSLDPGPLAPIAWERYAAELRLIAQDRGVAADQMIVARTTSETPALRFTDFVAEGPDCVAPPNNTPGWAFGCAQQRNLAAMIADPLDLVQPGELAPADAARLSVVMDNYRKGNSTTSKRSENERAIVSGGNP